MFIRSANKGVSDAGADDGGVRDGGAGGPDKKVAKEEVETEAASGRGPPSSRGDGGRQDARMEGDLLGVDQHPREEPRESPREEPREDPREKLEEVQHDRGGKSASSTLWHGSSIGGGEA